MSDSVLERLAVSPDKTAMVGDTSVDIEAGKNVGVTTIGATYGFTSRETLAASHPDYLIDAIDELLLIAEKIQLQ